MRKFVYDKITILLLLYKMATSLSALSGGGGNGADLGGNFNFNTGNDPEINSVLEEIKRESALNPPIPDTGASPPQPQQQIHEQLQRQSDILKREMMTNQQHKYRMQQMKPRWSLGDAYEVLKSNVKLIILIVATAYILQNPGLTGLLTRYFPEQIKKEGIRQVSLGVIQAVLITLSYHYF